MKTNSAVLATLSLLMATTQAWALGGHVVGNGGDGVRLPGQAQTRFFDLYEQGGIDPDRLIKQVVSARTYQENYLVSASLGEATSLLDEPMVIGVATGETREALAVVLGGLAKNHSALVDLIVAQLKELDWHRAPGDLLPNPDTKPFVDLADARRLGCARNIGGEILYSPSCSGKKMSPGNKAALAIHEALYHYMRSKPGIDLDSSYPVRAVTAAIFKSLVGDDEFGSDVELLRAIDHAGLDEINLRDRAIDQVFFDGNVWHSLTVSCRFSDGRLKAFELYFGGAGAFTGKMATTDGPDSAIYAEAPDWMTLRDHPHVGDDESTWNGGAMIKYDEASSHPSMSFYLGRQYGDGESMDIKIYFDGSNRAEASGNFFDDGDKIVVGECSGLPKAVQTKGN